jgi:hypothetical protein
LTSWDRSSVSEPVDDDDAEPRPKRGAVPPPPDEDPASVHLPRMEPPPASLGAMVQSRRKAPPRETGNAWWLWALLILLAALLTGYVTR